MTKSMELKTVAWHMDTGDDASWCELVEYWDGEPTGPAADTHQTPRPMVYLADALAAEATGGMMETKTYTTIDRAALGWPAGPWDDEPDKVQWPDAATGLPCLAVRHKRSGHWCGYVGVSDAHPLHGKDYGEAEVDVHGGLTFADACNPSEAESQGICHTPAPGEPDHVWWFGLDCAHAWDYSPSDLKRSEQGYPFTIMDDEQYRTLAYVQNECARLAGQLVKPNV